MNITRKVEHFLGAEGERVEALIAYDADNVVPITVEQLGENGINEPAIVYVGVARIMSSIPTANGPMPAIPHEVRFPIPVDTLAEAMSSYTSELDKFIAGLKEEQERAEQEAQKQASEELFIPNSAQTQAINNMKLTQE